MELQEWGKNNSASRRIFKKHLLKTVRMHKRARHLRLPRVVVGLDEDLPESDVLAHGHQRLLHGLPGPQDGHACDLPRPAEKVEVAARVSAHRGLRIFTLDAAHVGKTPRLARRGRQRKRQPRTLTLLPLSLLPL